MAILIAGALIAGPAPASGDTPVGWDACQGLASDPGVWPACADAASAQCVRIREIEGDEPWAQCLLDRAEEWETALVRSSTTLRERGNPAGDSGALARWMATRAASCHRQADIDRLTAQFGEVGAAAAVFQCELASNIQEAMRLREMVDNN
ncbi:MAG: hypothetical protein AAF501_13360 [Pseudomonadota bacterium]